MHCLLLSVNSALEGTITLLKALVLDLTLVKDIFRKKLFILENLK